MNQKKTIKGISQKQLFVLTALILLVPLSYLHPHSRLMSIYMALPVIGIAYCLISGQWPIGNSSRRTFGALAGYFLLVVIFYFFLSRFMGGRIIWKEVIQSYYFLSAIAIIFSFMRSVIQSIARKVSNLVMPSRWKKPVYYFLYMFIWLFLVFPYCLATFTIHKPKVGDRLNPKTTLGLSYKDVTLDAEDGMKIKGWFIPSQQSDKGVVIAHGLGANKSNFMGLASLWHEMGFNVIIFDFRGHGMSSGHTISMGYRERLDIKAAVNYLVENPKVNPKKIVGYGVSFGAASLLHAASEDPRIKSVIIDSCFADVHTMAGQLLKKMHIPPLLRDPIIRIGLEIIDFELGFKMRENMPKQIIGQVNRPILIIHGINDPLVPPSESEKLFKAARQPKKLLLLSVPGHYGTFYDQEYRRAIEEFLQKNQSLNL